MISAILNALLSTLFAVAIYGTLPCLIAGLIIFESRTRPRPSIVNMAELDSLEGYSDEDASILQSLKVEQDVLRDRKRRLYWQGDRSGCSRRGRDLRFDARGEGRHINAELESWIGNLSHWRIKFVGSS